MTEYVISSTFKNILCIRPDNMGDLLMSSPAIRTLKETFNAKITILTSSMAAKLVAFLPQIDEVLIADLPWVKNEKEYGGEDFLYIVNEIKNEFLIWW